MLICRRNVSSAPRWTHCHFVFLLFVLTMKCILCRYGNYPYEKYLRLEEDEQLWFFKINACELYQTCQMFLMVVYFSYRPWYVLLVDGKNDRCWMVLMFWNTFNIEIDCSVMRLSCLDELLNNGILLSLSFAWYF